MSSQQDWQKKKKKGNRYVRRCLYFVLRVCHHFWRKSVGIIYNNILFLQLYRFCCLNWSSAQCTRLRRRWRYIIGKDGGIYSNGGGGSVLMSAILLRQMLICYIVKTPDGLTDSEIWGMGILSAVLFVRARARDVPRRRTLPLPFCIQRKTHPAPPPQHTHTHTPLWYIYRPPEFLSSSS